MAGPDAAPPDWLVYVQMSEAYPAIKPWEWFTICEFWTDKIEMYLRAKTETYPAVQARHERSAQAKAR